MQSNRQFFLRPYQAALNRYLDRQSATGLREASALGRQAVARGLETLDIALIHEQTLLPRALSAADPAVRERLIRRARPFFAAAITPLEATHRSAKEANIRLGELNRSLNRRSLDLLASNQALKKEILRRHRVENHLHRSEKHSSRLLEQSVQLQEQLRLLSRRVLSVQEEERKRISRELHDVIAQVLTSINLRLAVLKNESATHANGMGRKIADTQRLVAKSVDIVHRFAYDLRPAMLDYLGLIPALHSFMKRFAKETGLRVSLSAPANLDNLSSAMRTVLYRVAQEALTNVARHARASRVDVSIRVVAKTVCMQIRDDGKSFDAERVQNAAKDRRLGLLGMRERLEMVDGTFQIDSAPGKGTSLTACIPYSAESRKRNHP
jgi:signal transduction histidine kinase